jgi:hypothetical protein
MNTVSSTTNSAVQCSDGVLAILSSQGQDPGEAQVLAAQQLLFASSPRAVCGDLGLNWWAALKLHEEGWLSFSPEKLARLDEAQEAELRFVGALVIAGCDRAMLTTLLSSLPKPYAYQPDRIYYDWLARRWRVLAEPQPQAEGVFTDWLETLVQKGDLGSLTGILELTNDAMARLRVQTAQPELYRKP